MKRLFRLFRINWSYLVTTFLIILYFELLISALVFLYDKNNLVASDKFIHFYIFSLLSFIFYFSMSFQDSIQFFKKYKVVLTIVFAVLIGTLVEFAQVFMPTRTVNIYDWIANFLGSLITVTIIKFTPRSIKKMRRTDEHRSEEQY